MPHFSIEYSANLEGAIDVAGLCEAIRSSAAGIDTFPTAGIRVRATRVDHYAIANGDPKHGFIDISIRLRGGRPLDVKRDATQRIFAAANEFVAPYMAHQSLALSLEMRDIDPELSPKTGTIRDHLET
ncbi:5-carboxymethyl-2-hydroxymuconate isomerase [Epibacterium sp. SM1979]|uniref:5-carboxymethyl-2-hydroxymuconate isomerase n=1 Tax=Tritonibacter litoralis TaxID=2662264 RepID=A0A843YD69_9RHOB|nr:5-carboxymethyl-2-hydroxymuconate isomerase [Tritonibacter litoralis]MQQ07808.1 5-carboxymethyl-2-hydroxymuconate isomerase [Tritonibacter litoralis]